MVSILGGLNLALCLCIHLVIAVDFKCGDDGLYGNPDNCLKFIICSKGTRQDFDCPQGKSWHADRGLCDTTDLSKCGNTMATSSGGSEDVFKQHLLSLLADFKPCHAGETTPTPDTTGSSSNPGGNPGTTPATGGGSSPNPGQGGNGSTPNPGLGDSGSTTVQPTSPVPPPTCPACPIPTQKPCPVAEECPACPTQAPRTCPPAPTCPPSAPAPTCPACPAVAACPAAPTCPPAPQCAACPIAEEKVCPTVASCPTTTPTPKKPVCENGWKYYASSCYFLGLNSLTAVAAQNLCIKEEATLASVHSEEENAFIYNLVANATTAASFKAWIGLYRTGAAEDNFANYDGTSYDFKKWRAGQLDNAGGNEFCVQMHVNTPNKGADSQWNDINCATALPGYVCKKPANT